ncbi:DUF3575 domain-containing protein [Pajaroellobacter abortibovis]|uniref:Uncharacterized protein n=1 Tax=Pajaroellobacter abortibovis TaxID=1882918 RepID=A0A1L6MV56_9BACT|nr:DUF3575 domain-containing protein [Pajaroellobacter abortibovis]APR99361.1 hypothetical protein BCY86_00710 [Pajaroellobacter abortibovis]
MKKGLLIWLGVVLGIGLGLGGVSLRQARALDGGGDASCLQDAGCTSPEEGGAGNEDEEELSCEAGICPTTTPDNWGCVVGATRLSRSGDKGVGDLLLAIGIGLLRLKSIVSKKHRGGGTWLWAILVVSCVMGWRRLSWAKPASNQNPKEGSSVGQERNLVFSIEDEEEEELRRRFALSYNPFTLLLTRVGLNLEALLISHHGLNLTFFYASTLTNEDSHNNRFQGVGGELGYRYYTGECGLRGLYVGPSLLLGIYNAIPLVGDRIPYWNVGGALDIGWQAIVANRTVVGVGGGIQYTVPSEKFPAQELPASVYAIEGFRPRFLMAFGFAFD